MNRYLEAVFFDLDGVLTEVRSSWRYVHEKLGVLEKANEYKRAYSQGKISYEEWMRLDTELWINVKKGKFHKSELEKILSDIKIREGVRELFIWLHKNGVKIGIISCGVEVLVNKVARSLGADIWISPRLRFDKRGYLIPGGIPLPAPKGPRGKGWAAKRMAWQLGVSLSRTAYVGDDLWDVDAFKVVGYPIAFKNSDPEVLSWVLCSVGSVSELWSVLKDLAEKGTCNK